MRLVSLRRELLPTVLVAAVSSGFGVLLLQLIEALRSVLAADDVTGSSGTVAVLLTITAFVFIAIAVYVGAVVTSNTMSTIVAGRTRTIALLRLLGSTASAQRRAIAVEGLVVGLIGGIAGALVATGIAIASVAAATAAGLLPAVEVQYVRPVLALPVAAVVLTTWLASWVGARRVLDVTPLEALGGAQERSHEETRAQPGRRAAAVSFLAIGGLLLAGGVALGLASPLGVLVGVVGGMISFTGVVLAAPFVMPRVLRGVGRLFGRSAPARLASENALRYPERSARTTVGLVIAVTLITMFAVAAESYRAILHTALEPALYRAVEEMLNTTVLVFTVLIGFSAIIAGIGMANSLSLGVLQRRRELGLLRALGFTAGQVRGMIRAEAAQLSLAAVLVGLVLGILYGWAGAQSLLGFAHGGLVPPAIPWPVLAGTAVTAALLAWAASALPSRTATRVSPVEALAAE